MIDPWLLVEHPSSTHAMGTEYGNLMKILSHEGDSHRLKEKFLDQYDISAPKIHQTRNVSVEYLE